MIVAAVQYRPPKGEPDKARKEISDLVSDACAGGARIVVLPEMATTGYIWHDRSKLFPLAEPAHGPLLETLSPIAAKNHAWIICGFPEKGENDTMFNSALVVSPGGKLSACYRKVLLFDADLSWAHPGTERIIIDSDIGRIVPGICMDLNDDGFIAHTIAQLHAIVPFCTNWLEEGIDVHAYWKLRLNEFNGIFIAANSWGFDGATEFCGHSAIFGPGMELLASAGYRGNEIIFADLDDCQN
jgi:predicted amidohydrolase